jgi:hypothetical protein
MTSIVAPLQLGELGTTRGEEHHAARSFSQAIRRDFLPLKPAPFGGGGFQQPDHGGDDGLSVRPLAAVVPVQLVAVLGRRADTARRFLAEGFLSDCHRLIVPCYHAARPAMPHRSRCRAGNPPDGPGVIDTRF